MPSLYEAAAESAGSKARAFVAWASAGGYNTKSHMRRLHSLDPDIPVHYVSGARNEDWLNADQTGVSRDPNARFANSSSYLGRGGHEGKNVSAQDADLQKLVTNGRNAVLGRRADAPRNNRRNRI